MSKKVHPRATSRAAVFLLAAMLLSLLGAILGSWLNRGIAFQLLSSEFSAAQRVAMLKQYFADFGPWAPVIYVGFVTVEVIVAPVPGILLYAPGGLLFGPVAGGLLAIVGNMLGASISCSLTRSWSVAWVEKMLENASVVTLQNALQKRGGWLIFLLRLNPLTSSDIVSYAAGFTRIPLWQVVVATGCGMAPLCIGQSWLSDSLFSSYPQLIYPLIVLSAGYLIAVVLIIRRLLVR